MQGLNKRFKDDPRKFLQHTAILEGMSLMANPAPAQGVHEFDLRPYQVSAAKLDLFSARGAPASDKSSKISAHWLPWIQSGTTRITLNDKAEYFFTSQLAGCQIRVVPATGGGVHPDVMHIAGNTGGSEWRAKQAAANTTPDELARSRALSTSGKGAAGYSGEGVNVVGFMRKGAWEFWGQQIDFENLTVVRAWQLP